MTGDGLTDLVRIRNGEVCYWPNLGYGRFGAKVTMDNAPWFDAPDQFDPRRIRLADIDGSGTTDIIYLAARRRARSTSTSPATAGATPQPLRGLPARRRPRRRAGRSTCSATAPPAWSGRRRCPAMRAAPLRYVDLMGGQKPHLLITTRQQPRRRDARPVRAVDASSTSPTSCAGTAVGHPAAVPGARRRARRDATTASAATASSPATPTTTATSTASSASSAASAWSSSGTPRSSRRSRRDGSSRPARTSTRRRTCRRCSRGPGSTPASIVGRERVSNYFAGLLDGDDRGEYYREPGLTDDRARGACCSTTRCCPPG